MIENAENFYNFLGQFILPYKVGKKNGSQEIFFITKRSVGKVNTRFRALLKMR
jgi:hypothetical protein